MNHDPPVVDLNIDVSHSKGNERKQQSSWLRAHVYAKELVQDIDVNASQREPKALVCDRPPLLRG